MTLNLIPISASEERGSLWQFLFRGGLELRECSRADILEKAADPNDLIHQYGLRRVTSFYEDSLLPAASGLPKGRERWRTIFEIGCQLLQMQAQHNPPYKAIELAREMLSDLTKASFVDDAKSDAEARRQVRQFLVPILARVAS